MFQQNRRRSAVQAVALITGIQLVSGCGTSLQVSDGSLVYQVKSVDYLDLQVPEMLENEKDGWYLRINLGAEHIPTVAPISPVKVEVRKGDGYWKSAQVTGTDGKTQQISFNEYGFMPGQEWEVRAMIDGGQWQHYEGQIPVSEPSTPPSCNASVVLELQVDEPAPEECVKAGSGTTVLVFTDGKLTQRVTE